MINFVEELNNEQFSVVKGGNGPCLVLAGAGSGKTRTIVYRTAYLLERGIKSENILLLTFTNKAAREMTNRIHNLESLSNTSHSPLLWAGTFHHIAHKILRRYFAVLGYKSNFSILDSEDSLQLLKLSCKSEGIDKQERRFPSPAVIHGLISFSRNARLPVALAPDDCLTLTEVLQVKYPNWLPLSDVLSRVATDYAKRKKMANLMDFDDLLVNLYNILVRSDKIREMYAGQFQYILVDEYQDTNAIQAAIIQLLAVRYRNILVVGDDAQSIYSFRAANIENILNFEKQYPEAKIFRLETNYRSTPNILAVANSVIANNRGQYQKELHSVSDNSVAPQVRGFIDDVTEADFIATEISSLLAEGMRLSSIAVLFRSAHHSQALEIALTKRNIPYEYRGGLRFFERAHIKEVLAYLRIFHNQRDVIAWQRVLIMQVGIGPAIAKKIINEIEVRSPTNPTLLVEGQGWSLNLPPRAKVGWNDFLNIWQEMMQCFPLSAKEENVKKNSQSVRPADLIQAVLKSKYTEYLQFEYEDYRERLADIQTLGLFASKETDLSEFLAQSSLQEQYRPVEIDSQRGLSLTHAEEKIILSTIHQAKGLEWEAVFVIHVSSGQFPNDRAAREEHGLEEERRLFYVAATRAKRLLYFSYSVSSFTSNVLQQPSIFLEEIDSALVEIYDLKGEVGGLQTDKDIIYVSQDESFPSKSRPMKGLLKDSTKKDSKALDKW